ncbi:MAG: lysophospholipid acyltransferase family protein [Akkermansiaceae bacterium]
MPALVSDEAYQFNAPRESRFWPWLMGTVIRHVMPYAWGIESIEIRGAEFLQRSIDAEHGVLITPNHCRPCDPMMLTALASVVGVPPYIMASCHLFRSPLMRWILPRVGAFSVNREGLDRDSLKCATNLLAEAKRPLVVFPEGVITRTNDRVIHLQEGVSFLARQAAKIMEKQGGKVVIHPLAIRYRFVGRDLRSIHASVENLEKIVGWIPLKDSLQQRLVRLGYELLGLKEIEYFGSVQQGSPEERLKRFMDRVLMPMEREFLDENHHDSVVMRVKNLRKALLPALVSGELTQSEQERRWKMLFDLELAQKAYHFPPDYIAQDPTIERMIETIERYEEVLGRKPTMHRPMKAILTVGKSIEVSARRSSGEENSLMNALINRMQDLLQS